MICDREGSWGCCDSVDIQLNILLSRYTLSRGVQWTGRHCTQNCAVSCKIVVDRTGDAGETVCAVEWTYSNCDEVVSGETTPADVER